MRITILAVGRSRDIEINTLVGRYCARCPWNVTLQELQPRGQAHGGALKKAEADVLRRAIGETACVVALDEQGDTLSSAEFAAALGKWRDDGHRDICMIIGGADGLDAELLRGATMRLAFGRMTWPHLLARAMLTEQIYRASTILAGHPYHRD